MCASHPPIHRSLRLSLRLLTIITAVVALLPAAAAPQPVAAQANVALFSLEWTASQSTVSRSVAWGDMDTDGDLDLIVGNDGQANQLYRNRAGTLTLDQSAWAAPPKRGSTHSVAWGDVDNDGDLDLAVGNDREASQFYRNNSGVLTLDAAAWSTVPVSATQSVAWGDVDNDGWLDLAVGINNGSNLLYRNRDGVLTLDTNWTPTSASTYSLAWGDVDNDGDLDLAVGNYGQPNQIYRNDGGMLTLASTIWTKMPIAVLTRSVTWGDVDGDGWLDLVFGNGWQTDISNLPGVTRLPSQLYHNDHGTLTLTDWKPNTGVDSDQEEPFSTWHVAFGDVDSDGDLDLVLSDYWQPVRLYRNDGKALASQRDTSWTPGAAPTYVTALGDVDNDGDLDVVVGNNTDQPLQLYRNDIGTLSSSDPDSKMATGSVKDASLAWGDVDGDGDLDLAIGNWSDPEVPEKPHPNELWLNTNGVLTRDENWNPEVRTTRSVAWSDVDDDGDLDLAIGNEDQPNQLFRNDHGVLTLDIAWHPAAAPTRDIAWGDIDGDGDLDLLVSNHGRASQLYRNLGTALSATPEVGWARAAQTNSVVWGDVDNDGDLDLAVGNANQSSQLYRNTGGALRLDTNWTPPPSDTQSVAWGDVDGDGDLDLAVGNRTGPNQLYRNQGGALSNTPESDWARAATQTYSVAWGDADGDGDLDLAVGNYGQTSQIYLNDHGKLTLDPAWSTGLARTTSVAWGDMDNDGDLDLALGNVRGSDIFSRYHWLMRNGPPTSNQHLDSPLSVAITRPISTTNANFFSTPKISTNQTISIPYTLFGQENDPVRAISVTYSLNGGGDWRPAIAASDTVTTNLAASREGIGHTFGWDVFASGFFGQSDDVVVRIVAIPGVQSQPSSTAGPFQHALATATTFPFRVRGTQVQVLHADDTPAKDALVYRIPRGQALGGQLFPARSAGQGALTTARNGYLPGHDALAYGDSLAALEPISSTASYTLYATNIVPNDGGLTLQPVTAGGVQILRVTSEAPLVLLNLQVSLEWDARGDEQFMRQLQSDLKRTSELLFDWSDGQIALGSITVYQNREHWNDAHIRIYGTNRMRPNAVKGGITEAERSDPSAPGQLYAPGQVRIGAVWNRYGEASANLGEDWPRTLAHELGHFALFLDDNYLGTDDNGALISVENCPGAMSDPYRDDYTEFHPDANWLPGCAQTLSQRTVGRSDWASIKAFYDQAKLGFHLHQPAAFNAHPGPANLSLALTTVELIEPSAPDRTLDAPIFFLTHAGSRVIPGPSARAFLFQEDRLIDLGSPTLDQVLARGARTAQGNAPADRLCVFDPSNRRLGCRSVSAGDQQLQLNDQPDWLPDLMLTPVTSTTIRLDVRGVGAGRQLSARLYPIASAAPAAQQLIPNDHGGSVIFTLPPDAPSFEGYINLWEGSPSTTNPQRETVSDYLMGGNPGGRWSRNAPRGNPGGRWSRNAPVLSSDGQAIVYGEDTTFAEGQFFALQAVTASPRPLAWATPVGRAYRLTATNGVQFGNTTLSISYLGDDVQSEDEGGIQMYVWNEQEARWQPLATRRDTVHNEASAQIAGPGLYMLMTSVAIPLVGPGWNLTAYPVRATRRVAEALAAIDGAYTTVYSYDASAAERWQIYDPSAPAWVNTLHDLQFGHAYWINATETITLYLRSDTSATQSIANEPRIQVSLARAAAATPVPPATFYGSVEAKADEEVVAWIGNVVCGRSHTQLIDGQIVYSIHVDAEGENKGCGAVDRTVRFTVGGRRMGTSSDWINDRAHRLALRTASSLKAYIPIVRK